jgi:hypothetical protein
MRGWRKKDEPATTGRRVQIDATRPRSFSYHANRVEQEYNLGRAEPREQDVRRREQLIKFWRQRLAVLLMGVLVLACVGYILHLSSDPQVIPLTSSSNDYFLQPTSVYDQAAHKALASSWLNGNKITLDTDSVKQNLQHQFPELSSVSITLPLMGHRPIIYIAPTAPGLVLNAQNGSYVLDTDGKALISADQVADIGKLQLPQVTDQSNLDIKLRTVALPASTVGFIPTVLAELQAKGVKAQSLSLPTAAYEFDLIPEGAGYYVKFNLHDYQHVREQVGTYLAVSQRLQSQGITPGAYIDVRLVGRAYYK